MTFSYRSLICTLIATTSISSGAIASESQINAFGTAMIVLTEPEHRDHVRYLIEKSRQDGLSQTEADLLFELTRQGLEKLRAKSTPMLTSSFK